MPYKNKILTIGSDILGSEYNTDKNLNDPMGISTYNEELWVANNGSGLITHYNKKGEIITPTNIIVPNNGSASSMAIGPNGTPTGLVYNDTKGFVIFSASGGSASSELITVTNDGLIVAYNRNINATTGVIAYNSVTSGNGVAKFKGVTIYNNLLYVTDYLNNKVLVFDSGFKLQTSVMYPFIDPNAIVNHSPFGIAAINGEIVVTYVYHNPNEPAGSAVLKTSYINVYSINGVFLRRLVNNLVNNSPWGLASLIKPNRNYRFGHTNDNTVSKTYTELLVGNYDINTKIGTISKYGFLSGTNVGKLKNKHKKNIRIPSLWGLNVDQYNSGLIYYTAGKTDNNNGTIGILIKK
jgi:uncharacterized protein (TIGR03118 family)